MRVKSITVILSGEELRLLRKPVVGDGGHQSLLRKLQANTDRATGEMTVGQPEIERIVRYRKKYGQGGFQDRLKTMADALAGLEAQQELIV
jgi:hypothetical protein